MKKRHLLKTMLLLFALIVGSSSVWAEDVTYKLTISASDFNSTSYAANNNEKTSNAVCTTDASKTYAVKWTSNQVMLQSSAMQWQKNSGYLYNSTDLGTITSVTIDSSAGTFTTYYGTEAQPSSSTTIGGGFFQIKVGDATGKTSKVEVTFTISEGSSNLNTNDMQLSNAPVALSFDLYNNNSAQTINYTTSSTGAVTVSASDYVTTSVDETNKTITVTPTTVTPSTQTITVNQAADENYAAGSKTFTVTITDSTPFTGGDVTFDATSDKGTNSSGNGSITKQVVTMSGTNCHLSDGVAYRLYNSSTTTISTTQGKITDIVFTIENGYNASNLSLTSTSSGSYSNGTWTGEAESVAFRASAQVRVTKIVVTVSMKEEIATINGISPTSINVDEGGSFTFDITYADGASSNDATVTWVSDNESVLANIDGDYLAGSTEGTANVTVTVTPTDTDTYKAVSKKFAVNVVDSRTAIATINSISPTSVYIDSDGAFTYNIEFADGTDASDYEVTWRSSDDNAIAVTSATGKYIVGEEAGEVTITVTVEPVDDVTYKTVSKDFTVSIVDPNAKGTATNPYTVAEVLNGTASGSDVYVKGFIVGCYANGVRNNFTKTAAIESNLALADDADESNVDKTIPIQLTSGTIREALNVVNKPYNIGCAQILVRGSIENYMNSTGVKSLTYGEKVAEYVTVSSAGYATYSTDVALDFSETNITVNTAKANGTSVALTEVADGIVPANTGVVLTGNNVEAIVPVVESTATLADNEMLPNVARAIVKKAGENDKTNYILSNEDEGVGFYLATEDGAYLPAHRAYLSTTATVTGNAPFLGFDGNETTGINSVERGALSVEGCYTLDGRRVAQPTKGLYIVNGRKVIIK